MMTFKEELEIILKELLATIVDLLAVSLEKTDYIVDNNIEALEELTKKEEKLINNMGIIENARTNLLDNWGVGKDTPISNVINRLSESEDTSELIGIKDKMTETFEDLAIRNKLNNDLIRENLDWIDFNMNLITSVPVEQNYGNEKGQGKGQAKGKSIFDRKV